MSAASRRVRFGALALAGLVSVTLCVAMANILGVRFERRFDVTATGEHRLAPRSEKLLASVARPYRIIIAGNLAGVDPRARQRVRDVLDQIERRTANITVREIDSSTPGGQASFDGLVNELTREYRPQTERQVGQIESVIGSATALADYLDASLSPALEGVHQSLVRGAGPEKLAQGFADLATAARTSASDLRGAVEKARPLLEEKLRGGPAPATDRAAGVLRETMAPVVEQLGTLAKNLKRAAEGEGFPATVKEAVLRLATDAQSRRDAGAVALDALNRMGKNDVRRVADVLARTDAVLVIGPESVGITAIEFNNLFPPAEWISASGAARADLGRRAEELLLSALAGLENPLKPVVVIVNADPRPLVKRWFTRITERLSLRGIDVCEWACVTEDSPGELTRLNPGGVRPVVYVTIPPNTTVGAPAPGEKTGVERAKRLGEVIDRLARDGKNILLDMNPSVLATFGQPDPTTAVLARFGLAADTGKPVVRERATPRGRSVVSDAIAYPVLSENPIAKAVKGLPLYLEWPATIGRASPAPEGVTISDLYVVKNDGSMWAESQWSQLWATRSRPELMPDQPGFDQRDSKADSWVVAAAAELRSQSSTGAAQRLVAVGGNTWFVDERAEAARIDGRVVEGNPGNFELFESAVYYLAGQDELIAQSPSARSVALIQQMPEARVRLIRLLVIAGIPALVLAVGAVFRWIAG